MTGSIRREVLVPQTREQVWRALTNSASLADWMYPNDFEARVGHKFTFQVPPNPKVGFEGLVVRCEVLECEPPSRLAFSWSAGGLADTRVSFRLEPDGDGTRVLLCVGPDAEGGVRFSRSFDAVRTFSALPARIEGMRKLDAAEVAAWKSAMTTKIAS